MNCPYCKSELTIINNTKYCDISDSDHFFRLNENGYFRLIIDRTYIGYSKIGYHICFNSPKDNLTKINPFKAEDSYILIQKYKKLIIFS